MTGLLTDRFSKLKKTICQIMQRFIFLYFKSNTGYKLKKA